MNEEEKKAINDLKRTVERYEAKPIDKISVEFDEFDYKIVKIVLNLIKKLQKENEELKEINEQLSENKLLQDIEIKKNFIPKQKIKNKIERIQKEGYWLFTIDWDSDKCVEVLQELLEK